MMVNNTYDPGCRRRSGLKLAGFLARSTVNGPGTRSVIWVQGCPIRCAGCFNPQSWPFSSGYSISVSELFDKILALDGIDGVTFSGGEPFAQASALAALGERLQNAGLNIVTYSGYTTGQLVEGNDPAWPALLAVTDLLISGPYIAALASTDPLKGSANQQVIPLGTKLMLHQCTGEPEPACGRTEFTITPDGTITTTGFPAPALLLQLASRCRGA